MHFGRIKIRLRGIGCGKELTRGALKCIENSNKTGGAAIQVFFPALILFSLVPLFFFRLAFPLCGLVTWDKQAQEVAARAQQLLQSRRGLTPLPLGQISDTNMTGVKLTFDPHPTKLISSNRALTPARSRDTILHHGCLIVLDLSRIAFCAFLKE